MNNNLTIKQIKLVFWRQDKPFEVVDLVPSCIQKCNYIHVRLPSFWLPRSSSTKDRFAVYKWTQGQRKHLTGTIHKIRRLKFKFSITIHCDVRRMPGNSKSARLSLAISTLLSSFCTVFWNQFTAKVPFWTILRRVWIWVVVFSCVCVG